MSVGIFIVVSLQYSTRVSLLVGGIPTPLKNDGVNVSWDDYSIPNCFWKVVKFHGSSHHQPVNQPGYLKIALLRLLLLDQHVILLRPAHSDATSLYHGSSP